MFSFRLRQHAAKYLNVKTNKFVLSNQILKQKSSVVAATVLNTSY